MKSEDLVISDNNECDIFCVVYSVKKIGILLSANSASLQEATTKINLINSSRYHLSYILLPHCASPSLLLHHVVHLCVLARSDHEKIAGELLQVKELSSCAGGGDLEGMQQLAIIPVYKIF